LAIFRNRTTHNTSRSYYLVNQIVTAVVNRKFKECTCKDYPNNQCICAHCLFKKNRLDKISVDTKLRFIYDRGNYSVVSSSSNPIRSNGEPYKGDFCDVCGRSDMELSVLRNSLKVCPICKHATIRW
jgi:hypothetical protein